MFSKVVLFFLVMSTSFLLKAQQSPQHFIPPIFTVSTGSFEINDYSLFLSTTEETSFYVKFYEGTDEVAFDSLLISRALPKSYDLGSGSEAIGLVDMLKNLNKPLNKEGLFLKADYPFFANTRGKSNIHGGSLTSKGLAALGTEFRTGHMVSSKTSPYNTRETSPNSHFISVMATEDNTKIRFSDFNVGAVFYNVKKKHSKDKPYLPIMKDVSIVLQKGQSYIIAEVAMDFVRGYENASFGLHITSNHPIAVNVGSITSLPPRRKLILNYSSDIGFDQIIPVSRLGNEYMVMQGEASSKFEKVVVVATKDNTDITVNGKDNVKLNAGEFIILDEFVDRVMFLKGNHPYYVYQNTAGSNKRYSCGFNFLPAWNACLTSTDVAIGDFSYLSTTYKSNRSYAVANGVKFNFTSKVNAKVKILDPVLGELYHFLELKKNELIPSFPFYTATYRLSSDIENILISSEDPLSLSLTYKSNAIGAASYFSGFITPPYIELEQTSISSFKQTGYVQLKSIATEDYESYHWYKDGLLVKETKENSLDISTGGKYKVVGVRGKCQIKSFQKVVDFDEIAKLAETATMVEQHIDEDSIVTEQPVTDEDSLFLDQMDTAIAKDTIPPKITFPNLNFEYDRSVMIDKSKGLLQEIILTLKLYPNIKLKIRGHTDCQGSEVYNQKLSEKRASYVFEYMVTQGIDKERLSIEGVGEKEPLHDCTCEQKDICSEVDFLVNRRVEFIVLYD